MALKAKRCKENELCVDACARACVCVRKRGKGSVLLNTIPCAAQYTAKQRILLMCVGIHILFNIMSFLTRSPYVIQMCQTSPIYCSMHTNCCIKLFLKQIEEYAVNLKVLERFILTLLGPKKAVCRPESREKKSDFNPAATS